MELAVFVLFALLAVASALVVVSHKNPVYSTMALVVTLLSLAGLFVLLGAPFIATLQVLIYTGAILVLFLFVIMLLNVGRHDDEGAGAQAGQRWAAIIGAGIFAGTVGVTLWRAYEKSQVEALVRESTLLKPLAKELFDRYLLAFEVIGVLLLVAVIAATVVARKPTAAEMASPPNGPATGV